MEIWRFFAFGKIGGWVNRMLFLREIRMPDNANVKFQSLEANLKFTYLKTK